MTAAVLALVASYVVLAVLLLSLNLRSSWRWPVKAAAIAVTASFFVIAFLAVQALLGWPTEAAPPARFQLHAALIREPARHGQDAGAIYLWLSPLDAEGSLAGPPRAHALPYSRELHERLARAEAQRAVGIRETVEAVGNVDRLERIVVVRQVGDVPPGDTVVLYTVGLTAAGAPARAS